MPPAVDPAFVGAGSKPGTEIWRIEVGQVCPSLRNNE